MTRKILGALMFVLGVVGLLLDYDAIRTAHGGNLHAINAAVEIGLMFAGVIALVPALAMEIAKDLPIFGGAITAVLPGGRRSSDPPPPPNDPTAPTDLTKPPPGGFGASGGQ
jgi:hypothetical protein